MALFHQGGQSMMLIDDAGYEAVPESERQGLQPSWVCETIAELEIEAGFPPMSLQVTVDLFNHHAERGEDPMFHKNAKWLKPLQAPFGLIDVRADKGTDLETMHGGFGVFTLGGLHTTIDGEVLNLDAEPIPGLFAAGRTTSGIQAWGYISGTSLGESTFFGRRAGRSAAASVSSAARVGG
jgi:3-oxo-5alpha-steroid 4-dehydrogenase